MARAAGLALAPLVQPDGRGRDPRMSPSRLAPTKPVVVVVEGLDGTGKSTAARLLADRLGAELVQTPPAELQDVRSLIDDALRPSPLARKLFYAATVALASDEARRNLAAGRSTVIDRYWLSTLAYGELLGADTSLAAVGAALLRPTLTLLLEAPTAVRLGRMRQRALVTSGDRESLCEGTAARLLRAFLGHARALSYPLERIDVTELSPDAVVEQVVRRLRP